MKVKVKAKSGQVCRLTESLCVGESPVHVELTTLVRRRLADGSLVEVKEESKPKSKTKSQKENSAGES